MINTLCKAPTQFGRRLRSNQAELALAKSGFLWGDNGLQICVSQGSAVDNVLWERTTLCNQREGCIIGKSYTKPLIKWISVKLLFLKMEKHNFNKIIDFLYEKPNGIIIISLVLQTP